MNQGADPRERRRQPRVRIGGAVVARVQTAIHAPIVDLSVGGALVDVDEPLRPGRRYTMLLPVGDEETVRLTGRVVRSTLVSLARGDGQPARYKVALEFVDVTAAATDSLTTFLARLHGAAGAQISMEPSDPV